MASRASPKFQATGDQQPSAIQSKPLVTFRVLFFITIWTLALANVVIVSREFEKSLPLVITPTTRSKVGIEDARRQALPAILAATILLLTLIPFTVGLPVFGIAMFLTRYVIEGLWSVSVSLLLLGGASALAPHPNSPLLPRILQDDLSSILALSFLIFILLTGYNLIMLFRITFLLGKGTPNLLHGTFFTLMSTRDPQPEKMAEKQPAETQPETEASDMDRLENGSAKSGWDDEENARPSKMEKRLAQAKSILVSPLKQGHVRS